MTVEAANRVLEDALLAGPRCGSSHVIAIDGPAGSGKTTLAQQLESAAADQGLSFSVVHTDEICPGWDGLSEVPRLVGSLLKQLARDATATYPTWDWHAGSNGLDATVAPADVVVIEGVGSGALACVPFLSVRLYIDAPLEVRKRRALDRDGDTFAPHWDRWARAEARYFAGEWSQDAPTG